MRIDLNADLGEGCGDDDAMLAVVSSGSVACGGHAGDSDSMHTTSAAARRRRVRVGAHPSYEDRLNFGRVALHVAPADLERQVLGQLRMLSTATQQVGIPVVYAKPHGALYHAVMTDPAHAAAVVRAVAQFAPGLPVLGPPHSLFLRLAQDAGLHPVAEGFADRAYRPDGTLVPRTAAGAVLRDTAQVVAQALMIATERRVVAVDGSVVEVSVESICLHGDTPGAVHLATAVRAALLASGVDVVPFA
ncbi:LamB/YcsF family protein [Tessaracoccus antarcticus]|uniref:LamB/YcsF family protein n=1 Tax=Tessaracoccus antarcticus TaxID=2479848 RepID=A0A3M0G978_9ACTN|nr:5-oxoprolinase subunit PxpA [Tessaracoccus antarcticus]RMB59002.1 LamB/YcsF family protein [Tessaracoccus antarcticus]